METVWPATFVTEPPVYNPFAVTVWGVVPPVPPVLSEVLVTGGHTMHWKGLRPVSTRVDLLPPFLLVWWPGTGLAGG
jgi:hypothetical protein